MVLNNSYSWIAMCMHPSIWPSICVCVWEWDINMNIIIVHTCFCFSVNTFLLEIRSLTDIVLQVSWPGLSVGLCKKRWMRRAENGRSVRCIITPTGWHWKASGLHWQTQLLTDTVNLLDDSLPSSACLQTHTHTVETENVWRFEHCHWAFSGWIITLGLSEQSASCPKSCQHPTYPKPSATVPCAYGIFAVFPTHFSWHTLLQLLEWHATSFFFFQWKT